MPKQWEVILPWPEKELSPNSRAHWAKKSRVAKRYRYACRIKTLQAIRAGGWDVPALRDQVADGGQIHVFIDFYPPDRRHRDDDNTTGSFKSGRDGLADALQIDDRHFRTHPIFRRDEPVKGGMVRVVVTTSGPEA
ncbi:hypothetical protein BG841_10375 [Marinobacter sp. X15-166B]|nr:hypothetical protein BG841_10375 [Marinobacter sp. X15-166B]